MGNLDFSNSPGFSWYCVLLLISGIAMIGMTGVPGVSGGSRIANLVFGLGFACYALYLIFVFQGGHYFMFFKAFILPVVLIAGAVKSMTEKRKAKQQAPYQPPVMNYGPGSPAGPYGQQMPAQPVTPPYAAPGYGGQPAAQYAASAPTQPLQQPMNGGYQPVSSADAPTQAVPAPQWGPGQQ